MSHSDLVWYLGIYYFITENQGEWPKLCVNGDEQSPIRIDTSEVETKKSETKLKFKGYNKKQKWTFVFGHETGK